MAATRQCEFFLLRYVPDAVNQESVNLGVVLLEEGGFAGVRFAGDLAHVQCVDPDADLEMLHALESDLRSRLSAGGESRAEVLKRLDDAFSNLIQLTETKACLAEDPAAELDALARIYLEHRPRAARPRESSARVRLFREMRGAFEQAGVWRVMRKSIAAADYVPGDPLKIDCGYRPNGTVRLFQALPLGSGMDAVKALAFSYPGLREGIRRAENAATELTALVEEEPAEKSEEREFAVAVLERAAITVVPLTDLAALAERARRELNL